MKIQSVEPPPEGRFMPVSIDPGKVLRSIVDVACVIDENGFFQYVSPSCLSLFGYTTNEFTGTSFWQYLHPDDIEKTRQILEERTPDCHTSNFCNRYKKKDGNYVYIIWSGRWDAEERLIYCVARDGTELYETEMRLAKAQQLARVAHFEYDVIKDCYKYVSDSFYDIFGLSRELNTPFTTRMFWKMIHPDDLSLVRESIYQPEQDYCPTLEYRIIRPDGKLVYINRMREVFRDAAGKPVKTIGIIQDITDRKIGEMALQQSEERFRHLVQKGNDLIGIIDKEGNYTFIGGNIENHMDYTATELVGKNALQFIHPEDLPWVAEALNQIQNKETMTVGPFRFMNGKGAWRWVTTVISNHLHNPSINGLVVNSKDVTEKKLKDDELLLSEQRFKALVQNSSDIIVILSAKGKFLYVSDNITTLLGYKPEELMDKKVFEFIHPDESENVAQELMNVLQFSEVAKGIQHRFLHKNGNWVWLESKGSNHQGNFSIQGILINARHIDDRVKLQKKLDRALINKQREITSAVIKAQESERSQLGLELHDNVNQILTTVKLYNEMYLSGYVQDKTLLLKATQYTQDCINEIRSISKRLSAPTLGKISLNDSIKELVDSINLTKRVEIIYRQEGIEPYCVSEDLHLAIYRIVQEGLNNVIKYAQAQTASIFIEKEDNLLCLKIWDDGIGFDTGAKRAGIGITNMKTRAESLNATFTLNSNPGKGCKISICFPLDEK